MPFGGALTGGEYTSYPGGGMGYGGALMGGAEQGSYQSNLTGEGAYDPKFAPTAFKALVSLLTGVGGPMLYAKTLLNQFAVPAAKNLTGIQVAGANPQSPFNINTAAYTPPPADIVSAIIEAAMLDALSGGPAGGSDPGGLGNLGGSTRESESGGMGDMGGPGGESESGGW